MGKANIIRKKHIHLELFSSNHVFTRPARSELVTYSWSGILRYILRCIWVVYKVNAGNTIQSGWLLHIPMAISESKLKLTISIFSCVHV